MGSSSQPSNRKLLKPVWLLLNCHCNYILAFFSLGFFEVQTGCRTEHVVYRKPFQYSTSENSFTETHLK